MTSAFEKPNDMMVGANNVGTGWWPILRDLEQELTQVSPGYTIAQVKEKFGGLRYYAAPAEGADAETVEAFNAAIRMAEARAETTCENCGAPAELKSSHGWYVTLCDEHFAEREAQREQDMRDLGGER